MMAQPALDLVLAADIFGTGVFVAIGIIHEPAIGLAAAIRELENGQADPYVRTVLVNALAARISGHCIIRSAEAEAVAQASLLGQIVMEWRISIPKTGTVQALFVVKKLVGMGTPLRRFDLALQLAGRPAFTPLQQKELEES